MRKVLTTFLIGISFMTCGSEGVSAATIIGTAPIIYTGIPLLDAALNQEIGFAFDSAISDANDSIAKYSDQRDLARGFGNASVYSSQAATLQGFQNYSRIAVTTGVMLGIQAPSTDFSYYDGIEDDIEANGDIHAGVGVGVSLLNVGVNAKSIRPNLYLNFMFGFFNIDPTDELTVSTTLIGVGVNYTLAKPKTGSFLFKWRGLSVGTGLIYHSSALTLTLELDSFSENFVVNQSGNMIDGTINVDPSLFLELKTKTVTIPLDITTSAQVLQLFNFTLGTGLDFNIGKTDIIVTADGDVKINNINDPGNLIQSVTPGMVIVEGSTKGISPSFGRLRIMSGLGFNFGPVKLDLPIRYYFGSGASLGVTAGVVF